MLLRLSYSDFAHEKAVSKITEEKPRSIQLRRFHA